MVTYTDYLHRLAWGTDAGFYRLLPKKVFFPTTEEEVIAIFQKAAEDRTPITFRAAGTSLSGQSLSDNGWLVVAGKQWERYQVLFKNAEGTDAPEKEAYAIRLQPGLVGSRVNDILKPYGRQFAPDPASVNAAMVGGIIMNNASGMNCGTHANSHEELLSVRLILSDGTLLDTGDNASRNDFRRSRPQFVDAIKRIREDILANPVLTKRIKYKYSIKNVTGLNLLPFVRFEDPFDIIAHLMVGSEGTLAFLSEATLKTEPLWQHRASAMLYFPSIADACRAVQVLKKLPVISAELLDRKALRSIEDRPGIPAYVKSFPEGVTAVLVETASQVSGQLTRQINRIEQAMASCQLFHPTPQDPESKPFTFTREEDEYAVYWNMRAGIFPSVGGMRPLGTTCLIEDVAFHLKDLPQAATDLQALIDKHGYTDGVIYGHALEGNFHFILNQSFDKPEDMARYTALMDDVISLVVDKYDGSLKAEHGTGRNMAPFVKKEWGEDAFKMMQRVKQLFDPQHILNPGVIFNDDPQCHIKHFKPLPPLHPEVDRCIECGFCEPNCLTAGLLLSSRQRIVIQREMARLRATGEDPKLLNQLDKAYFYPGRATCAGDGLCGLSCPMGINTGHLTHVLREVAHPKHSRDWKAGKVSADHFHGLKNGMRLILWCANTARTIIGNPLMAALCRLAHKMGIPLWTPAMPKPHRVNKKKLTSQKPSNAPQEDLKVVYFPSCINQAMGVSKGAPDNTPLTDKMVHLLHKAGYQVIFPDHMDDLCCGTIWESKGMPDIANAKTAQLNGALWTASQAGKYPVLCDQSPCLYRMRERITTMKLYEPVEFIEKFLVDRLDFHTTNQPVAIHTTCTMQKMGLQADLRRLANRCSTHVFIPAEVGCCGFAGDKGFTRPEVNAYALRKLKPQLEEAGIKVGYSNSRTCEIGLTTNGGVPYMSIVYLVDAQTSAKANA